MRAMLIVTAALVLGCMSGEGVGEPTSTEAVLRSTPEGAVVFRDGQRVGTTPYEVPASDLPARLELRADTYAPESLILEGDQTVTMKPGVAQLLRYDGRFANDPELTPQEVAWLTPKELPLVRNEIFARYGRPFTSDDIAAHFAKQSWYVENPHFTDAVLTDHDKANAALLKSFEGEKKLKGEYTGSNETLIFVDERWAELTEPGEDLYNWEPKSYQWASRGDWLLLWDGEKGPKKADTVWLYRCDHTGRFLEERIRLDPRAG